MSLNGNDTVTIKLYDRTGQLIYNIEDEKVLPPDTYNYFINGDSLNNDISYMLK